MTPTRRIVVTGGPGSGEQDAERRQDLDEAQRTFDAMAEVYPRFGYDLIALPKAPVAERLAFVLSRLA